jgi:hypothetical protein
MIGLCTGLSFLFTSVHFGLRLDYISTKAELGYVFLSLVALLALLYYDYYIYTVQSSSSFLSELIFNYFERRN